MQLYNSGPYKYKLKGISPKIKWLNPLKTKRKRSERLDIPVSRDNMYLVLNMVILGGKMEDGVEEHCTSLLELSQ